MPVVQVGLIKQLCTIRLQVSEHVQQVGMIQKQELFLQMSRRQPEVFAHAIVVGHKPEYCTGGNTRTNTGAGSAAAIVKL